MGSTHYLPLLCTFFHFPAGTLLSSLSCLVSETSLCKWNMNMKHKHCISVTPATLGLRLLTSQSFLSLFFHLLNKISHIHWQELLFLFLHLNTEIGPFSASGYMDEWHIMQEGEVKWELNKATALSCQSFGLSPVFFALENTWCIVRV